MSRNPHSSLAVSKNPDFGRIDGGRTGVASDASGPVKVENLNPRAVASIFDPGDKTPGF